MTRATTTNRSSVTALPRVSAALLAALATLLTAITPVGALTTERVVVQASQSLAAATDAVLAQGGRVLDTLDPFGIVVATVPVDRVDELTLNPATATVSADVPLTVQSSGYDDATVAMAADAATATGHTGAGVGVVLVDTGVNEHADLAGRVVASVDLTDESDGVDHHGHGTFLAGLIAGSGASSDGEFAGVAPSAHLVSVKVAGADGETTLSTVLQGLVAADRARGQFNAPVVLLALSGPAGDVPDPVMMTLEMLWSRGSTVVVAAGNNGSAPGSVGSPGADPYLLTVGSIDDSGAVAAWSGRGPNPWGQPKPDVVAPGVSVVGLRNPGSTIDSEHPTARVGDDYFRGSGTSMSAALVAGAAAVVLADDPALTPDGVKGRLMGSAAPVTGADVNDAGAGLVDVSAAVTSDAGPANSDLPALPTPQLRPGRGNGNSADWADRPGNGRPAAPGVPGKGSEVAGWSWAGWSWAGWSWSADGWAGWSWADEAYWAGWSWNGWSWNDAEWAGWSWNGWTWAGWTWAGWTWAGWTWNGWTWNGWTWSGWTWNNAQWG